MPNIGSADLSGGAPPRIIVSIVGAELPAPDPEMDIAELRLDTLEDARPETVVEYIRSAREQLPEVPLLGTVRMREELGRWRDSEARRLELFEAITPLVDGVDIEARAEFRDQIVDLALRRRKGAILSRHILDEDPSAGDNPAPQQALAQTLPDCVSSEARENCVFKLAAPTADLQSVENLLRTLQQAKKKESTAWMMMGMGAQGPLSRVMAAALGSVAVYARPAHSSAEAAAPGQMPLALTRRCLDLLRNAESKREGLHQCVRLLCEEGLHKPETSLEDSLRWADRQLETAEQDPDRFSPASAPPA